jgi:hypothetical protein
VGVTLGSVGIAVKLGSVGIADATGFVDSGERGEGDAIVSGVEAHPASNSDRMQNA